MRLDADVAIIGGGLAGACLANLLTRPGGFEPARVSVVEPRLKLDWDPAGDFDLRVSAISRASEKILRNCGVWDVFPATRLGTYERMCVWDESGKADGSGAIQFDCADINEPNLGHVVENVMMQRALLNQARERGVQLICGSLASMEPHDAGMAIELHEGGRLHAGTLVAADGAHSSARRLMGIAVHGAGYAQRAIVTHIRTGESHRRTAWQRFLTTGPLALLPLAEGPDGHRCSIVWSTTESAARELMAAGTPQFCEAVEKASDGVLGRVLDCVRRVDFPLGHSRAETYVLPRFALVGDAAHAVHPLAGQGVNLGFLDCAALAQTMIEARTRGEDPGAQAVLRRYERWRKGENLLMLTALDGLNRLFSNTSTPLGLLRWAGLTAANRMSPLKDAFMRRALGIAGDLPAAAVQ